MGLNELFSISQRRPLTLRRIALLSGIEGLLAIVLSVWTRSERGSAVLFGLSRERLLIVALMIAADAGWFGVSVFADRIERSLRTSHALRVAANAARLLAWGFFWLTAALFFFAAGPAHALDGTARSIAARLGPLLVWIVLLAAQLSLYLGRLGAGGDRDRPALRWSGICLFLLIFAAAFMYYDSIDWGRRLFHAGVTFLPAPMFAGLLALTHVFRGKGNRVPDWLVSFLTDAFIFALTFASFRLTAYWVIRTDTPAKAYWGELADAFLKGRLYLENPLTNHDLTLFQGRWYVPNPPMPALVLIPFVAWLGLDGVNMTVVSALVGALNVLILIWTVRAAIRAGFFDLSDAAIFWLAVAFALGTNNLWLVTLGQMWFVAQLMTVCFIGLSCLATLRGGSPWLIGAMLGCAMLCRPNVFPTAFFLAGIMLARMYARGAFTLRTFPLRAFVCWSVQAAIPVVLSVALLLAYNWLRFGDGLDFGYVTINGAPFIVEAARRYGMFHPHFLPANWRVMITALPRVGIDGGSVYFRPGIAGYSIFIMTPPIVYAFRRGDVPSGKRVRTDIWRVGAWISILLSVGMLLLYHNTGAEQIGYRYLMDFVFPLFLLMAAGMRGRASWFFILLTIVGMLVNALSLYWWYFLR